MKEEQPKPNEGKKGLGAKAKEFVEKHPWWTFFGVGLLALAII